MVAWREALEVAAAMAVTACAGGPPGGSANPAPIVPALGAPRLAAVNVTSPGYHNETSAAIDPHNVARVAVSYQVPATVAVSSDSGRHWTAGALPGTGAFQLAGDPSVVFDSAGRLYALYIAFDRPDDYDTLGRAAHRNGIFLNRSDDGGKSWWHRATAIVFQPERKGIPFEDKPMMAANGTGGVFVAWTEFRRHQSVILFSRSEDGGRTFQAPIEISDHPGSPRDSVGADEGTDVAIGPDGTIYVVWSDSTGVLIDRSTDGGHTFGRDRLVQSTPDIVFDIPGVARANGYPSLEVDPASGRLYVLWVDGRSGHPAVWLTRSDDHGDTWTAPSRVAPGPAGESQFFGWLALDRTNGALLAGYYQTLPDHRIQYMAAWSGGGGRNFRQAPWGAPFSGGGEFLGDYTGVAMQGGVGYGAWTETQSRTAPDSGVVHTSRHSARVVLGRAVWPEAAGSR